MSVSTRGEGTIAVGGLLSAGLGTFRLDLSFVASLSRYVKVRSGEVVAVEFWILRYKYAKAYAGHVCRRVT